MKHKITLINHKLHNTNIIKTIKFDSKYVDNCTFGPNLTNNINQFTYKYNCNHMIRLIRLIETHFTRSNRTLDSDVISL